MSQWETRVKVIGLATLRSGTRFRRQLQLRHHLIWNRLKYRCIRSLFRARLLNNLQLDSITGIYKWNHLDSECKMCEDSIVKRKQFDHRIRSPLFLSLSSLRKCLSFIQVASLSVYTLFYREINPSCLSFQCH